MTGSIPLLRKILLATGTDNPLYHALNQFVEAYQINQYEEHFKNILKIAMETFSREMSAFDYNIYTDRGFTDIEIVFYFNNNVRELNKYLMLLETKINSYFLAVGVKRIHNLSFVCKNIQEHPKF